MKIIILSLITILYSGFGIAQTQKSLLSLEEREARKAKFYEIQMKKNGGIVIKPGSQQGRFLFVYDAHNVELEVLDSSARKLSKEYRIAINVEEGTSIDVNNANRFVKENNVNLVVFVLNNKNSDTTLLVAPENRWGILNISPLIKDVSKRTANERIEKEIKRLFAILSGSFSSQFPNSLLSAIKQPSDLDNIDEVRLPHDVKSRAIPYLASFGITPYVQTNFRKACQEGWAPAPTNDIQKAIWEKVHAMPTAPIKIKPETKKVKE